MAVADLTDDVGSSHDTDHQAFGIVHDDHPTCRFEEQFRDLGQRLEGRNGNETIPRPVQELFHALDAEPFA